MITSLHQATTQALDLQRLGTLSLPALPPLSLYVHLPWCIKKCPYCDFNSHAVPQTSPQAATAQTPTAQLDDALQAHYLRALMTDLEQALPLIWGRHVHSIFIGGGTPSLFAPERIAELLSSIRSRVPLVADCEITLEANPGTFEKDRFAAFRQAGVTRLSIGVQSFDDAALARIGRVHSGAQARAAVAEAAAHFDTFNLDLMYALPQQTANDLAQDLATALAFAPPHLSVYHLTLEPNTYFAKYPPTALPSDDDAYAMLDLITERTEQAGLGRYEVSAFARSGHRCWHNWNYWQFGDYLGIGAGAHSKISFAHRVLRQVRQREPQRYMQLALEPQRNVGQVADTHIAQSHDVKRGELPFEYLLNALRLREGFAKQDYTDRTGLPLSTLRKGLDAALAKGLITETATHITPTERGFDFLSDLQELFL